MKRQSDLIENLLDQLAHDPVIKLSKRQLRHLYGVERIAKNTWKDLFERLPAPYTATKLYMIEEGDEIFLVKKDACKDAATVAF